MFHANEGDSGAEYYNHTRHLPISPQDAIYMDKLWNGVKNPKGGRVVLHASQRTGAGSRHPRARSNRTGWSRGQLA